jgi:hypothetical protein
MGGDLGSEYGSWEYVPKWHPARLLGYDIRRLITEYSMFHHEPDWTHWRYGRSRKVAREMLRSQYAETHVTGQIDWQKKLVWNGKRWIGLDEQ